MDGIFEQRRYLIPFRSILLPQIFTDTLVIGAGSAGLRAALAAAKHGDVIVLAKAEAPQSNSAWAQGGIATVLDASDSTDSHIRDTMNAGAGLCDEGAVRSIIEAGSGIVEYLLSLGFRADQNGSGAISLGREGGHSHRRILHADGDATGRELMRVLLDGVARESNIRMFDRCFALDLLTPPGSNGSMGGAGQCLGAITHHPQYGLQVIWAKATILASGGAGVVWRETTNPPVATGDGLAMAFRAGAALADLAFMQFHPTTLYVAGASRTLISEAVRGEGAYLLDGHGNRFMQQVHELGELAPRDIVSHGIADVISSQGLAHVWLDARHIPNFSARFPGIAQTLAKFDLDASQDLIPVNPAAHYMVGGVQTDLQGRTTVPGLYAVGEVGSTGLHGANRLASNSLLESLVVGERAGEAAREMLTGENTNPWGVVGRSGPLRVVSDIPISDHGELDLSDVRSSLRSAMWRNVGLVRTGSRLRDVAEMFDFWARYTLDKIFDAPSGWEVQNMLLVGSLIARAAAWREESRGCHQRQDFGQPSERFGVHDVWTRGQSGVSIRDVDMKTAACEA